MRVSGLIHYLKCRKRKDEMLLSLLSNDGYGLVLTGSSSPFFEEGAMPLRARIKVVQQQKCISIFHLFSILYWFSLFFSSISFGHFGSFIFSQGALQGISNYKLDDMIARALLLNFVRVLVLNIQWKAFLIYQGHSTIIFLVFRTLWRLHSSRTHSFTQNNNISNLRNGVKSSCTWRGIWWGRLEGVIYWQDPAGAGTMKKKSISHQSKLRNCTTLCCRRKKKRVYILHQFATSSLWQMHFGGRKKKKRKTKAKKSANHQQEHIGFFIAQFPAHVFLVLVS